MTLDTFVYLSTFVPAAIAAGLAVYAIRLQSRLDNRDARIEDLLRQVDRLRAGQWQGAASRMLAGQESPLGGAIEIIPGYTASQMSANLGIPLADVLRIHGKRGGEAETP